MKTDYRVKQDLAQLPHPDICYIDTALGNVNRRNRVQSISRLEISSDTTDAYTTMFRFRKDYHELCETTGSVKGAQNLSCWSDFLWFDIDSDDLSVALANARQLVIRVELIDPALGGFLIYFFSGAKGFHIGIPAPLLGLCPSIDLPQVFKKLAREIAGDIEIDISIYDKNRLWRVPNTRNGKSGLFKIPLTFDELATCSIERLLKMAKQPAGQPSICLGNGLISAPNAKLAELVRSAMSAPSQPAGSGRATPVPNEPGWVSHALVGLQEGNRNTTFTKIAGKLHQGGLAPDDILALLEPHALAAKFPVEELQTEIKGICRRYPRRDSVSISQPIYSGKTETESKALQAVPAGVFLSQGSAEISWCVEGLLPVEGVGILAGPAGYGKSWMLLDLAIESARGGKWLGYFATSKGSVLFIDEESSPVLLRHRLRKALAAKGLQSHTLDMHLAIGQGLCLSAEDSVASLRQLIDNLKPSLVIIDSLIRVHRAEENSATEMARVFAVIKEIVRETSCSFFIADHQRKPSHWGIGLDLLLRGSTEKAAFVDTLLSLRRKNDTLIVEHSKSRFAEPVSAFVVRIEDPQPGITIVAYAGEAEAIKQAARLEAGRELLTDVLIGDRWIPRKELIARAREEDVSEKALSEALKALESEDVIERDDRKPTEGRGGKAAFYRLKPSEES